MAHAHGVGRHAPEEVEKFLEEDLRALSDFLGTKFYFCLGAFMFVYKLIMETVWHASCLSIRLTDISCH